MKRIVAFLLAVLMMFTAAGDFYADQTTTVDASAKIAELGNGLMTPELIEVSIEEVEKTQGEMSNIYTSEVYNHQWDKYSTNYVYNLLATPYKEAWDTWDASCRAILNSTSNLSNGYIEFAFIKGISDPYDALHFFELFKYSNPQYYFVSNGITKFIA